jgi:hypothetical protein
MRLDIPELLYYEFYDAQVQHREALDNALLEWLYDMRKNHNVQIKRLTTAVYVRRVCDALQSICMLRLPLSASKLCNQKEGWMDFLEPLRISPERDPALDLKRLFLRWGHESASFLPGSDSAADFSADEAKFDKASDELHSQLAGK